MAKLSLTYGTPDKPIERYVLFFSYSDNVMRTVIVDNPDEKLRALMEFCHGKDCNDPKNDDVTQERTAELEQYVEEHYNDTKPLEGYFRLRYIYSGFYVDEETENAARAKMVEDARTVLAPSTDVTPESDGAEDSAAPVTVEPADNDPTEPAA